ncbi:unnamed protein product [Amoebophrya sp. A25]|nr:unnamed protein product [Amoebophrya sp. A25]|eukprot:GSA25T00004238001.1
MASVGSLPQQQDGCSGSAGGGKSSAQEMQRHLFHFLGAIPVTTWKVGRQHQVEIYRRGSNRKVQLLGDRVIRFVNDVSVLEDIRGDDLASRTRLVGRRGGG